MVRSSEPIENNGKRYQGLGSVRNPPFPARFVSGTLRAAAATGSSFIWFRHAAGR